MVHGDGGRAGWTGGRAFDTRSLSRDSNTESCNKFLKNHCKVPILNKNKAKSVLSVKQVL